MRSALVVLTSLALSLAVAASASAEEVTARDDQGRTIRFDVRASGVDVEWHADLLRDAIHADEIEDVTIRVVEWSELRETCGRGASGCYRRRGGGGLVVVPAGESSDTAHTLVHEYGHHVDAESSHGRLREPNGTSHWWRVRGLARLVELESVARSYRLGWDRSIAEIFAEDYAYVNLRGEHRIRWLEPPTQIVLRAIRADLGLGSAPAGGAQVPALRPVTLRRSGTLEPSERASVDFGLLGPDRRVTFSATLPGPVRTGDGARLAIVCDGATVRTRTIGDGRRAATIDLPRFGPAQCDAVLTNTGLSAQRFQFQVRLSVRS
jgi:hypothetical protein